MRWMLGFSRWANEHEDAHRPSADVFAPAEAPGRQAAHFPQLDEMGQRGELIRVRVSQLAERLEEVKSLPADFAAILDPLAAITAELPKARVRNAELEALLARERDVGDELRRQVADVNGRANTASTELSAARTELARVEAVLRDRDAELQDLRGRLAERSQAANDLDRRLGAETGRVRELTAENKALRAEVQALDQSVTRVGSDLVETRERLTLAEQDARRLQLLSEEQVVRVADLTARADAVAEENTAFRERLQAAENRLAAEIASRERTEAQAQVELGMVRTEAGNLTLRLEAASSRAGALERLLEQIRSQLRERGDTVRAAERATKESEAERHVLERRLEAAQAELARAAERAGEAQQQRNEVEERADGLAKALAAKDAALEQALSRAATLADQGEQLTRRGESERAELELAIRRLTEDLLNERSLGALARGALDIARESRATLQRQYDALKRSMRAPDGTEPADGAVQAADEAPEPAEMKLIPPRERD